MPRRSLTSIPSAQPAGQAAETAPAPKYSRPKVLLLDTPESVLSVLQNGGFNVVAGSLGSPYAVEKSSRYQQLIGAPSAPNHTEREVVVVDLSWDLAPGATGEPQRPETELDLWGKCDQGFLDPRVRGALTLKESFDRIHADGGVFVVFANCRTGTDTMVARRPPGMVLRIDERLEADEWGFLSCLMKIDVKTDSGTEMHVSSKKSPLMGLLARYLDNGSFSCSLRDPWNEGWQPLAENKFGDTRRAA